MRIDRTTLKLIDEHKQNGQTNQCAFRFDGNYVYVTNGDGGFDIFEYPSFKLVYRNGGHGAACSTICMAPSGEHLALGSGDGVVSIWDTSEWACLGALDVLEGSVKSVDFSFDGGYVTAGSDEDKKLYIAHVGSREYVHTIDLMHPATQVAWHPCRYVLAYSQENLGLKIAGSIAN